MILLDALSGLPILFGLFGLVFILPTVLSPIVLLILFSRRKPAFIGILILWIIQSFFNFWAISFHRELMKYEENFFWSDLFLYLLLWIPISFFLVISFLRYRSLKSRPLAKEWDLEF